MDKNPQKASRPYGGKPSLLSPPAPMDSGATNRKGRDNPKEFGEDAVKATAGTANMAGNGGAKSYAANGNNGSVGEAVRHLEAMKAKRPDKAPNGRMIKR